MTSVNVIPQSVAKTCSIVKILSISVTLYESAIIQVSLCDEQQNIIEFKTVSIDGPDYANWGNSDDYLENIVLIKLGFTKQ